MYNLLQQIFLLVLPATTFLIRFIAFVTALALVRFSSLLLSPSLAPWEAEVDGATNNMQRNLGNEMDTAIIELGAGIHGLS